jgi:hypothetical protein
MADELMVKQDVLRIGECEVDVGDLDRDVSLVRLSTTEDFLKVPSQFLDKESRQVSEHAGERGNVRIRTLTSRSFGRSVACGRFVTCAGKATCWSCAVLCQ